MARKKLTNDWSPTPKKKAKKPVEPEVPIYTPVERKFRIAFKDRNDKFVRGHRCSPQGDWLVVEKFLGVFKVNGYTESQYVEVYGTPDCLEYEEVKPEDDPQP